MEPKPGAPGQSDLVKLAKGYRVELKSHELPQELESRLRKEEADAALERRKNLLLFLTAIAGVVAVAALCAFVAARPGSSADDKKWATAVLTSVVSAAVGFLAGKNSR